MASPKPPSYIKRDKTPALNAPNTDDRHLNLFLENIHERIEAINNLDLTGQLTTVKTRLVSLESGSSTSTSGTGTSDAVVYRGDWDASTGFGPSDSPAKGDYYVVSVGGETSLDGHVSWNVGDWAVFNGDEWDAVRNYTISAGDNVTLTVSDDNIEIAADGGDEASPEYIRTGTTYIVPVDRQVLYALDITLDGTLQLDGSLVRVPTSAESNDLPIATVSANTQLDASYWTVLCDATSGAFDVQLPAAADHEKRVFNIKKIDSSVNVVTITTTDGDLVEFATDIPLAGQGDVANLQSNGSAWYLVA